MKQTNAKKHDDIASSAKPHWSTVPTFLMTAAILLLTCWMAWMQYNTPRVAALTEPVSQKIVAVESEEQPKQAVPIKPPSSLGAIRVLAWNIESGGNDPKVIANELKALQGYDVVCLCEVGSRNFATYQAAYQGYGSVESKTGGGDRLQIVFDDSRSLISEVRLSCGSIMVTSLHASSSFGGVFKAAVSSPPGSCC